MIRLIEKFFDETPVESLVPCRRMPELMSIKRLQVFSACFPGPPSLNNALEAPTGVG